MYEVYTLPTCDKCHKAMDLMGQRGVEFEEVNTASPSGRKKIMGVFKKYRDQLQRDDSGMLLLPLVLYRENGQEKMHQGEDGLVEFLNENE